MFYALMYSSSRFVHIVNLIAAITLILYYVICDPTCSGNTDDFPMKLLDQFQTRAI